MSNLIHRSSASQLSKADKHLTVYDLSPDQRSAYDAITEWIESARWGNQLLTLGGYAGTGKSSLLGIFAKESSLAPIAFCTFTGKASSVLARKLFAAGVHTTSDTYKKSDGMSYGQDPYCGTIHRLIYAPVEIYKCLKCKNTHGGVTRDAVKCCNAVKKDGKPCAGVMKATGEIGGWSKREELDREYKLIIIDEASMVSDDMLMDLRHYNIPILAVGDHGQLPPVNGLGSLMASPDIRLEKIHRQAESNPIIQLSKIIRETGRLDRSLADGQRIIFDSLKNLPKYIEQRYKDMSTERLFDLGMICYTNSRRVSLNAEARKARGFVTPDGRVFPPQKGDQVICLRNQNDKGIFNGMRATVTTAVTKKVDEGEPPWKLYAELDFVEENRYGEFSMCADQFNRPYTFKSFDEMLSEKRINANSWEEVGGLFDFGYALTCHKAQGSQYEDVLVVIDGFGRMGGDEQKKWIYTSVTRSSNKLTILT